MKKKLPFLFILFSILLYSQENENSKTTLDSLKIKLQEVEFNLNKLNNIKTLLKDKINLIESQTVSTNLNKTEEFGVFAIPLYRETEIRKNPDINSETLIKIAFKDSILVINRFEKTIWLKVKYKNIVGYVSYNIMQKTDKLLFIYDEEKSNRLKKLTKQFGSNNAIAILNNKYWLGMSTRMAEESLGIPKDINSTVGSWGKHEQWIYSKKNNKYLYLYFENGKLASFQD